MSPKKLVYFQNNKNVDIKFSPHDAFLWKPSSGTLKLQILESQIIKCFGAINQRVYSQNLSLSMSCFWNCNSLFQNLAFIWKKKNVLH